MEEESRIVVLVECKSVLDEFLHSLEEEYDLSFPEVMTVIAAIFQDRARKEVKLGELIK